MKRSFSAKNRHVGRVWTGRDYDATFSPSSSLLITDRSQDRSKYDEDCQLKTPQPSAVCGVDVGRPWVLGAAEAGQPRISDIVAEGC